jgi:hypothetical protein
MAVQTQPQAPQAGPLIEEEVFPIRGPEAEPLIKSAIESAIGVPLQELAPGMWWGTIDAGGAAYFEITARATAVQGGTAVELRAETKYKPGYTLGMICGMVAGAMFVLPMVALIIWATRRGEELHRRRMILLHKTWRELGAAVGAPKRASYRDEPRRAYRPRVEAPQEEAMDEAVEDAEAAEVESP